MFKSIKNYTINELYNLIGKNISFISDCEFFPNFNVSGKLIKLDIKNNEILFTLDIHSKKNFVVGSNMKNLKIEINY